MKIYCVYGHGKETEVRKQITAYHKGSEPRVHLALLLVTIHIYVLYFMISSDTRYARGAYTRDEDVTDADSSLCDDDSKSHDCQSKPLGSPLTRNSFIDAAYTDEIVSPKVGIARKC
jgi:hypothetical protein